MKLTGKAKEDFILWCENNSISYVEVLSIESYLNTLIIEWFDSVGIYIELNRFTLSLKFEFWHYTISDKKGVHLNNHLHNKVNIDSRQEATEQAIIKANEIYNKTHE